MFISFYFNYLIKSRWGRYHQYFHAFRCKVGENFITEQMQHFLLPWHQQNGSSCWRKFAFVSEREIILKSFPRICRQKENFHFGIFHHLFLIFHADSFFKSFTRHVKSRRRKVINLNVQFILFWDKVFARFMQIWEPLAELLLFFDYFDKLKMNKSQKVSHIRSRLFGPMIHFAFLDLKCLNSQTFQYIFSLNRHAWIFVLCNL